MKKIFIAICFMIFTGNVFSQDTHWSNLSYFYSNGTVSPEYQYSYQILLNEDGEGILNFKNADGNKEKNFNVSAEDMVEFNKFFTVSDVFTVDPETMKAHEGSDGGSIRKLEVTMWQSPELDAMPRIIRISEYLNKKYTEDMRCIYKKIEALVPEEIYKEFKINNK